ncbi:MAG TPA: hypothetical protein VIM71_02950 [Lacunisphaera sp.]
MDETLHELENELKRLTPRRPSGALMAALERELGAPTPVATPVRRSDDTVVTSRSWKWVSWPLAAAATIAFAALFQFARREPTPLVQPSVEVATKTPAILAPATTVPENRYEPVQAISVLYDMKEDGTATLADQSEGRRVRYRYVDTYTWKNPATNASLRWSVPRDEVRVIRASLN